MGLLDIFRRRGHSDAPVKPPEGTAIVPEGCRLDIFTEPPPIPAVNRIPGGALIASQGVVGDEPASDLEKLLGLVEDALQGGRPEVVLVARHARISDAFSGSIATQSAAGVVIWVLNPATFVGWRIGPALLQRLLDSIFAHGARYNPPITQSIYVTNPDSPAGAHLTKTLGHVGVDVRTPDPKDRGIVATVKKADGSVVTGFLGSVVHPSATASEYCRDIRHRKYLAQLAGNTAKLVQLQDEERENLGRHLSLLQGKVVMAVEWAPRLRRLLADALDEGEISRRALFEELIQREAHLVFVVNSDCKSAVMRSWPELDRALEVFPDFSSARAATVGNDPEKTVTFGDLAPREVFAWMAKGAAGIAIRVDKTEETPRWVLIGPELLAPLSEGRLPN